MNTPAHLLLGAAAFGETGRPAIMAGALLGALAPDASLYVMAGWALFVQNVPPQVVFDELYYSQTWQTVFAIDNSMLVWGAFLALAIWRSWPVLIAVSGAALLHLVFDFALHAGDGRPHFWPLSGWVFDSPISYWDSAYHAIWVMPVSILVCAICYVALWRRGVGVVGRLGFGALLAAEVWVATQWFLYF